MKIILHFPQSEDGKTAIARELAAFHAEQAAKKIQNLPCPTEQKVAMLDAVVKDARKKDT